MGGGRTWRALEVACWVGAVAVGLGTGLVWLFLAGLALVGTRALAPRSPLLLAWPVGLAGTVVLAYVGHVLSWLLDAGEMTRGSVAAIGLTVAFVFAVAAVMRACEPATPRLGLSRSSVVTSASLAAAPLAMVVFATIKLYSDPRWLVSAHIGGGDHAAHATLVRSLMSSSTGVALESPFSFYTYPKGIHHLVALLGVVHRPLDAATDLVVLYSVGGWFESVQFAAYVSLAMMVVRRIAGRSGYRLAVLAPMVLFAVASTRFFVTHLYWSGFTTSLGITWMLLIPLAVVPSRVRGTGTEPSVSTGLVVLVAAASWIVYQPYAVALVVVTSSVLLCSSGRVRNAAPLIGRIAGSTWVVAGVSFGAVLALLIFPGRDSHLVDSFLLDGDLFRPSLTVSMFWAVVAVAGLVVAGRRDEPGPIVYLVALIGVTAGFATLVSVVSGAGLFQLPYYVEKMVWVLLYVSLPVGVGACLRFVGDAVPAGTARRRTAVATVGLLAFPLVTGGTPANATRHSAPEWFVASIMTTHPGLLSSAVAYHPIDPLGSHLSNLALRVVGAPELPSSISLQQDTYAACRIVNGGSVRSVVTVDFAVGALWDAGCLPDRVYLSGGRPVVVPDLRYFPMKVNHFYKFGDTNLGRWLLLRGFRQPESWGTWATGYMSTLGLEFPEDSSRVTVILGVRRPPSGPTPRTVDIFVENVRKSTVALPVDPSGEIEIDLGARSGGEKVDVGLDCSWSLDQARAVDPTTGPPPCLGLEWIRIIAEPAVPSTSRQSG